MARRARHRSLHERMGRSPRTQIRLPAAALRVRASDKGAMRKNKTEKIGARERYDDILTVRY